MNERLGSTTTYLPPQGTPVPTERNVAYRLYIPLPGFMNAADAMANRNPRNTQQPGDFHVFNVSGQAVNITRTQGRAGSWINGALNIPPTTSQEIVQENTPTQTPNTAPQNTLRFDIFGTEHFIEGEIVGGRASALVRELLEAIGGLDVNWDGLTRTIIIRRKP